MYKSLAIALSLVATPVLAEDVTLDGFSHGVGEDGSISRPAVDFRADWTMLGAWSIAGEEQGQGAAGMHVVYAQPEAVTAYRETGEFPDGTMIIKELWGTTTNDMTTGTASYASDPAGLFVMVRDRKDRFADNPLWGDGWGWAFFDADPNNPVSPTVSYVENCKDCHIPAAATDRVFVQGYPVLKK